MLFKKKFRKKNQSIDFEDVLAEAGQVERKYSQDLSDVIGVVISNRVIYFIIFAVFCIALFFIYKVFGLQILKYDIYAKRSLENNYHQAIIPSIRGSILDRNGIVLAKTIQVKDDKTEYYTREYIDKEGFGNILGFVTYPKKDAKGTFWQESMQGVEGLESYYDLLLAGKNGVKFFEKNSKGEIGDGFIAEEPINGKDLKITIDADLQAFAYKQVKAFVESNALSGASLVLMGIENGEILAMISYPTYNPNKLLPESTTQTQEEKSSKTLSHNLYHAALKNDTRTPFLNRPIAGAYTPGSIVKPLFALAGLNTGNINENTSFFSSGQIEVPSVLKDGKPAIFRDWKAHGWTNVSEAIAVSSDVFFYTMVGGYGGHKGIGIRKIDEYSKAFKFDEKTGIDLKGEKTGVIPTPEWKEKIFNEPWRLGDTYNSSIGQFGFTITPLTITRIIAGIVNNGYLPIPHLYQDLGNLEKEKVSINIEKKWYDLVKKGMRQTVTSGTAKTLNLPYVSVAAKTGTAEIGNSKRYVHTWIVGYFPYDRPKYAFAIVAEKGSRKKPKNPSIVMKDILDWMSLYRPEYIGLSKEEAFLIRSKIEKMPIVENSTNTEVEIR